MGFRQALFLGGAVLVLAACSDATGPEPAMRKGGAAASAKSDTTVTTTQPKLPKGARSATEECRTGFLVSSGRDSTCAVED